MHKICLYGLLMLGTVHAVSAQQIDKTINAKEALRIERILAADNMRGRKTFSPELDSAANFIAGEFKKSRLQPFPGLEDYMQHFTLIKASLISVNATADSVPLDADRIIAITTTAELHVDERSGYTKVILDSSVKLLDEAARLIRSGKSYVVFVDTAQAKDFPKLKRFKRDGFKTNASVLFVLIPAVPARFNFYIRHSITAKVSGNVIGMIPGKSKPGEFVVFGAHYDHLGITKPNAALDSVYNGANDDAAGTTAVIMLARYFSQVNNNERSIIFVAFTGEEIGGYGSSYFSTQINPDKIVAMFNIEMIGTESKWGKNSAYITGYDKTDFGRLLQKNLTGSQFHFEPDPYPEQNLFYRSDNATLAKQGVPAHTISTSKMDAEKYYHTVDDEIETLDMENMANIIKAIAISSSTILAGIDTPSRVDE